MKSGSCHCGNVKFTVEGDIDKAIECNCSHCSRKGLLLWFVPRQSLSIDSGKDRLTTYMFNKHVIQHQFCPVCGCAPFALGKMPDGAETAAINIRCLEDVDLNAVVRTQFNGRDM